MRRELLADKTDESSFFIEQNNIPTNKSNSDT